MVKKERFNVEFDIKASELRTVVEESRGNNEIPLTDAEIGYVTDYIKSNDRIFPDSNQKIEEYILDRHFTNVVTPKVLRNFKDEALKGLLIRTAAKNGYSSHGNNDDIRIENFLDVLLEKNITSEKLKITSLAIGITSYGVRDKLINDVSVILQNQKNSDEIVRELFNENDDQDGFDDIIRQKILLNNFQSFGKEDFAGEKGKELLIKLQDKTEVAQNHKLSSNIAWALYNNPNLYDDIIDVVKYDIDMRTNNRHFDEELQKSVDFIVLNAKSDDKRKDKAIGFIKHALKKENDFWQNFKLENVADKSFDEQAKEKVDFLVDNLNKKNDAQYKVSLINMIGEILSNSKPKHISQDKVKVYQAFFDKVNESLLSQKTAVSVVKFYNSILNDKDVAYGVQKAAFVGLVGVVGKLPASKRKGVLSHQVIRHIKGENGNVFSTIVLKAEGKEYRPFKKKAIDEVAKRVVDLKGENDDSSYFDNEIPANVEMDKLKNVAGDDELATYAMGKLEGILTNNELPKKVRAYSFGIMREIVCGDKSAKKASQIFNKVLLENETDYLIDYATKSKHDMLEDTTGRIVKISQKIGNYDLLMKTIEEFVEKNKENNIPTNRDYNSVILARFADGVKDIPVGDKEGSEEDKEKSKQIISMFGTIMKGYINPAGGIRTGYIRQPFFDKLNVIVDHHPDLVGDVLNIIEKADLEDEYITKNQFGEFYHRMLHIKRRQDLATERNGKKVSNVVAKQVISNKISNIH